MDNQNTPLNSLGIKYSKDTTQLTVIKKPTPQMLVEDFTNDDEISIDEILSQNVQHKDILEKLLSELQPIDFPVLIRPELKILRNELQAIIKADSDGLKDLHFELNKSKDGTETSRYLELEVQIKTLKKSIKEKHYVVCIITELLKIATSSNWNLCKRFDYVYIYNGAFWKQLSKDDLKQFLGKVAIKFSYPEIDAKHHLFKDELLKQFLTQAHLETPEIDTNKILINLQNGTFEFINNQWELRPFDPKDFITYQLPFAYDPLAVCPKFDKYLNTVLPDFESREVLQEFSGYIFTKLNLEKALILTGGGANGKSVFFNILTSLIGRENTLTYSFGLFSHEYNRAKLTNVLLNYSSEKGTDLNSEILKTLISSEPLQAREPYGKPFEIHNSVKFIMNCNELPKETESTDAYFRRFIIIPFDIKIPAHERDINLAETIIKDELTGVFNWLLIGLARLARNKKFTESQKLIDALADFRRQSDNVALFIEGFGYKPNPFYKKTLSELYVQYKQFCLDDGYKYLGKNKFSQRLISKGFEQTRVSDGGTAFNLTV